MFDMPALEDQGLQLKLRLDCSLSFPALPAPFARIARLEPLPSLRGFPSPTT